MGVENTAIGVRVVTSLRRRTWLVPKLKIMEQSKRTQKAANFGVAQGIASAIAIAGENFHIV